MKLFLIAAAFFVLANLSYGQSPDVCTNGGELEKRKGTCPSFPPTPPYPSPSSPPPPHISHDGKVIHCKCDKECPEYMKCCKVPHRNATCMKPKWEGDMSWDKKTEEAIKKWEEKMSAQKENDDHDDCDDDDDHPHHKSKDKMHTREKKEKKKCHHRGHRIAMIVAPVTGLVLIIGMVALAVCYVRRRRQRSNATKSNVTFDVNNYYVSQDNEKNKEALKSGLGQDFSPEVTLSALPPYRKLEENKEQV